MQNGNKARSPGQRDAFNPTRGEGRAPPLERRSRRPEGNSGTAADRDGYSVLENAQTSLAWRVFQARHNAWERSPTWPNLAARRRAWAEFYASFLADGGARRG
jgi:hypothetical protein